MFNITCHLTLDSKNRVNLSKKHLRQIKSITSFQNLFLTRHIFDFSLLLYTEENWLKIAKYIDELPNNNKVSRAYKRIVLGFCTEINLDKAGRISIPTAHIQHAHLEKDIVMIGQGHYFEIWDLVMWNDYQERIKKLLQEADANIDTNIDFKL